MQSETTPSGRAATSDLAERARKHYRLAIAEYVCIHEWRRSNPAKPHVDIREACAEHWTRMWAEWDAFAALCRELSEVTASAGRPVATAMLRGIADKLTQPGPSALQASHDALELIESIFPSDPVPAEAKKKAEMAVIGLPLLDESAKWDLLQEVKEQPGRPAKTRPFAVPALEMHNAGKSWSQIERALLPQQQWNKGKNISDAVRHLKNVLKKHNIPIPDRET